MIDLDWEVIFQRIKGNRCPESIKNCNDDSIICSACWGKYIEELALLKHKDDIVMNQGD